MEDFGTNHLLPDQIMNVTYCKETHRKKTDTEKSIYYPQEVIQVNNLTVNSLI